MVDTRTFEYSHDGLSLIGQLATPAGPGPFPGVMVMHDGQGVSDFVRHRALRLAEAGYAALATDMFGEGGRFEEPGEGIAHVMALRKEEGLLRGRVLASLAAFTGLPVVDSDRIGAIGYCFGGQCVLELARCEADVRSVVSFHGTLTSQRPARAGQIRARIFVLTGALDPFAPADDVEAFRQEMSSAGADWTITTYSDAKHGFTDPVADKAAETMAGVGYDALLDRLSWQQATAFLKATLRE